MVISYVQLQVFLGPGPWPFCPQSVAFMRQHWQRQDSLSDPLPYSWRQVLTQAEQRRNTSARLSPARAEEDRRNRTTHLMREVTPGRARPTDPGVI